VLESAPRGPGAGGADAEGNLGLAFAREAVVAPASDFCSTMVLVVASVLAGERESGTFETWDFAIPGV
jgi:hypothetical protein